ncbi:MAG: DNA translocase FtsK [Rikenellaceae bacterium]
MINKFSLLSGDEMEEHLANYPIGTWSYSKLATFSRNEKAFERRYLWNERSKRSVASIAGNAYHEALRVYFEEFDVLPRPKIVELSQIAYDYIGKVSPNQWKTSKTMPTIGECISNANKIVLALLTNFLAEIEIYIDDIDHIYTVEANIHEWVCVNGVDIPVPLSAVADIVVRTKDGRIVVIDHKSLKSFTSDDERAMTGGKQAITYVLAVEQKLGITVDEVWFIENKYSKNRDKSPQLRAIKIEIDKDSRRLYEAMLYQHLKRMLEAVNDPDYIYTMNDSDHYEDLAELYDFWMRSMIADVDDFNISQAQKDHLRKRTKKTKDASLANISPKAIIEFRKNAAAFITMDYSMENMTNSEKIEHLLRGFGYIVDVASVIDGYSSDTYLLQVATGLKIKDIHRYRLDIASALSVSQVNISPTLKPYEGKSYVVVDVTKKRERDLFFDQSALAGRKLPIGRNNFEDLIIWDLDNHATPHVLVCGATGSGKSVSIKSTIAYAELAGVNDIRVFDPKYEFCDLNNSNIKVYNDIEDIESEMALLVADMQDRTKNGDRHTTMVIFDEFADALSQARKGKALGDDRSLEENLQMILQKGRSLGFRVLAATKRASTKVINGDAKVNFPVQICFRVPKAIDSMVVLDEEGAEGLAGLGDGLMNSPEYIGTQRFQGYYKP